MTEDVDASAGTGAGRGLHLYRRPNWGDSKNGEREKAI